MLLLQSCSDSEAKSSSDNLPFFVSQDLTPVWIDKDSDEYGNIHKIANFSFIDQDSNTVTNKTFAGKIYIADFFFTSCLGLCTNMSAVLQQLQKYFKEDNNVLILSHSVTPKIDTVPVLKKYADRKHAIDGKWFMVTGERSKIYEIARKSYFADENYNSDQDINTFFHSENFYLVDQLRRIRGVYNGTLPADMDRLKEDIKILEKNNI